MKGTVSLFVLMLLAETCIVMCPPLAARDSGWGNQFKLHANGHVIAVNKAGTYSFADLDPGRYLLVSQSVNANGFEMELEAGKTYLLPAENLSGCRQGAYLAIAKQPGVGQVSHAGYILRGLVIRGVATNDRTGLTRIAAVIDPGGEAEKAWARDATDVFLRH